MRKITANIIFPITSKPIHNGYLIIDNNGFITDIIETNGEIQEIAGLEYYSGILIPGLVFEWENGVPEQINNELKAIKEYRILFQKGHQTTNDLNTNTLNPLAHLQTNTDNFNNLLCHHTIKLAEKYKLQNNIGSFEIGKNPGVLYLSGYHYKGKYLSTGATLTRLV